MVNQIVTQDLYKIYKSGTINQQVETVALRRLSFTISQNDFITVMGPSGSGKTTLLNILGGLDTATAGSILYQSESESKYITKLTESQLDLWRRDKIGVVFQKDNLLHHLTALENVELPLKFLGIKDTDRAKDLLTRLGLGERINHRTYELSAGERQRVALAAALVFKPAIILADEPTGELDSQTVAEVMKVFQEVHKEENVIFFLVTHNPLVAKYGTRFFTLNDGYLDERVHAFSYDDFANQLDEYIVIVDKMSRMQIPIELLRELPVKDGLYELRLSEDETKIIISDVSSDDIDEDSGRFLVQVDPKSRILLPSQVKKKFSTHRLTGKYDSGNKEIILEDRT